MSELGRADRHLILISGAVASGKTTLALSLAGLARMRGIPAASIDIDELVVTVAGPDWSLVTRTDRLFACELAGVLTERLFDRGERLVAIAGSTLSSYEWQHVVSNLSQAPHATYVLLHVSLDEAVRRAQQDSTGPSRNLEIVARVHSDIDWSTVRRPDIEVDTDNVSPDEMAETVWRAVFNDLISAYHDRWLKKSRKKPPKRAHHRALPPFCPARALVPLMEGLRPAVARPAAGQKDRKLDGDDSPPSRGLRRNDHLDDRDALTAHKTADLSRFETGRHSHFVHSRTLLV